MISILITLLVVLLVVAVVFYILTLFPIPAPWVNVIRAVVALILLVWLISWLLPLAGHPAFR